jgi:DNA invertase Pin-like site-specific DNA recombinase
MKKKYISWRRVSTFKQGRSGLGLEAQKEIIRYFIERDGGEWVADYEECYTGKELSGCTELRKAIEYAKRIDGILVIAKTDRFRNTIEALQIYDEMGDGHIMFCDLPSTDKFTLTLFFALAEREALLVSIRTKQALKALKDRGVKLGAASVKYKENYNNLSPIERRHRQMKHGTLKRERHHQKPDFIAFKKILKKVFPEYTKSEDVKDWMWGYINMKKENREKVFELMKDFKDLDSTGRLFKKFDFENDMDYCEARIHPYLQSFRKSCIETTKEV